MMRLKKAIILIISSNAFLRYRSKAPPLPSSVFGMAFVLQLSQYTNLVKHR